MDDSRRQQIVDAWKALLQTITVVNKYKTNIGLKIFEHKTGTFQESDCPGVSFKDGPETVEVAGQNHIHNLVIENEIKTIGSTNYETTAMVENRKAMSDIETVIATDLAKRQGFLGGRAQAVSPVQTEEFELEKKDRLIGSSTLSVTIRYVTKAFQPYS